MHSCPSRERLQLLLANQVGKAERTALEKHVEECARCQQALEELTGDPALDSWRQRADRAGPGQAPDEDFLKQLRKAPPVPPTPDLARGITPPRDEDSSSGDGPNAPSQHHTPTVPGAAVAEEERVAVAGFEILGVLGRGGMGVVYRARQVGLNRLVALKMILGGPHAESRERARFRAEAEAVARLQHPHIVQIHEIGEHDGLPYFALEHVDGGTLAQRLDWTPALPRAAAELVETLARAVHYAHQRAVVHRDLKPSNILLAACGLANGEPAGAKPQAAAFVPKITDFGLAKRMDADTGPSRTGAVLGTPS
jgi:serine/threonine protein kinase